MTQEQEILELLHKNNGQFETKDIPYNLSFEFRRAVSMLRKKGYIIIAERLTQNNWKYTLVSIPNKNNPYNFDEAGQGVLL